MEGRNQFQTNQEVATELPTELLKRLKELVLYRFLEERAEIEGHDTSSGRSVADYDVEMDELERNNPSYANLLRVTREELLKKRRKDDEVRMGN